MNIFWTKKNLPNYPKAALKYTGHTEQFKNSYWRILSIVNFKTRSITVWNKSNRTQIYL